MLLAKSCEPVVIEQTDEQAPISFFSFNQLVGMRQCLPGVPGFVFLRPDSRFHVGQDQCISVMVPGHQVVYPAQ